MVLGTTPCRDNKGWEDFMRRSYLAFIAVLILVALTTPDAQSVTKEEVEVARTAAEKTRREAAIRQDNASDEYESARAIQTAAEFEAFNREHDVRITTDRAQDLIIERQREEAEAIRAKKAAQKKAVKEEYAKAAAAWKKADADVKERRKKEMQACTTKARKDIFAGYPPEWIEQEKMLRQLTGQGTVEFALLQDAFSQAVAKCHQKIEKSFPRPQAPSYVEIEKRHRHLNKEQ